jgi:sporulation protein YlmC with PRC-barrel domain
MPDLTGYQEWTLQPGASEFQTVGSDGLTYTATLSELTGGTYSLAGRSILNNLTHKFAGSVPISYESRFLQQGDGSYLFVNLTGEQGVNTFGSQTVVNATSVESQYVAPDGSIVDINIPYASINRVGKQLIVNDTSPENIQYRWAEIGTENLAPGYRFATTGEAINYGVSSALLRNYRTLVTQLADEGMTDENGNPIETITDAANYLARSLQGSETYAHIFQLGK